MSARDGFVETSFGRMHFLEQGSGPALLLFHSNGCSAEEFRAAMGPLSERFRAIAWDMPGQGDSDAVVRHLSMADYAAAAIELMDALSIMSATVLGSSVGASIAAEFAATYPDRTDGAVIVELPLGRDRVWWETNWTMVERMFSVPTDTMEGMARRYRIMTQELYDRLLVDRHKAGTKAMMSVMWAGRDWSDSLEAVLAAIRCPLLFLLGSKGVATSAADRFAKVAPASQLHIIPDCGHFPFTDDVAGAVSAVLAFDTA